MYAYIHISTNTHACKPHSPQPPYIFRTHRFIQRQPGVRRFTHWNPPDKNRERARARERGGGLGGGGGGWGARDGVRKRTSELFLIVVTACVCAYTSASTYLSLLQQLRPDKAASPAQITSVTESGGSHSSATLSRRRTPCSLRKSGSKASKCEVSSTRPQSREIK
jgi:hypothetical protein